MQNEITFGANLVPVGAKPFCSVFVFHTSYRSINSALLAQCQIQPFRKLKPPLRVSCSGMLQQWFGTK
jgi:hypothetical protein